MIGGKRGLPEFKQEQSHALRQSDDPGYDLKKHYLQPFDIRLDAADPRRKLRKYFYRTRARRNKSRVIASVSLRVNCIIGGRAIIVTSMPVGICANSRAISPRQRRLIRLRSIARLDTVVATTKPKRDTVKPLRAILTPIAGTKKARPCFQTRSKSFLETNRFGRGSMTFFIISPQFACVLYDDGVAMSCALPAFVSDEENHALACAAAFSVDKFFLAYARTISDSNFIRNMLS